VTVTKRLSLVAAAVVLAVPLLSSCGFNDPTDQLYTPSNGANDRSGTVDVLDALIVSGSDGSGTLIAGLVNNDQKKADQLVSVTGSGKDQGDTASIRGKVKVPAGGANQLATKGQVSVTGSNVKPSYYVTLTLSFKRAEDVTLQVPVTSPGENYTDVPLPSGS
jgi:outer membrane murein-binding lipoprotein Lpp